ncbi:r2d2 [Cochliomyia hominivorax]
MLPKSSVSALQEYCARHKIPPPVYEFIDSEDGGAFVCQVQIMDKEADGTGRSKRDAKHLAAHNIIQKLRKTCPDIDEIQHVEHMEIPTEDMVVKLRDFCVQHQHPLPVFEIVQQGGSPDAPEFIAVCSVASIKRYGVSEKKKDAKQIAALAILNIIADNTQPLDHQMQVAPIDSSIEDVESQRYHKFKSYRELDGTNIGETAKGILLVDRHNYFVNFHKHIKELAWETINNPNYEENDRKQVMDLFHVLKITPRITAHAALKSIEKLIQIEINCDYDAFFLDVESNIYSSVIEYFRDMLN